MSSHAGQPNVWVSYGVTALIVLVVLALRMRRAKQMRRLRLEWLWIVPALYGAVAVMVFALQPPTMLGWSLSFVGLLMGAAVGWQRGRMMEIHVDPQTHSLNQRASPAAILFIVVLLLIRQGVRILAEDGGGSLHLNAIMITDILIAFALGMFCLQRLEMFLRAKRLLAEARR